MQSACILLGCILKSAAANLGFALTEGLINRMVKGVTSSDGLRFNWKVLSSMVETATVTCFFSPSRPVCDFYGPEMAAATLRETLSAQGRTGPLGVVVLNPLCQAHVQLVTT